MKKKILDHARIRAIHGGFAFIPHQFLTGGFLNRLEPSALLLYLFLILVSDRCGISYYGDSKISKLLKIPVSLLPEFKQVLVDQDLIAIDPPLTQVLELPDIPVTTQIEAPKISPIKPSSFSELIHLME